MRSNHQLAKIVLLFTFVVTLLLQGCCDLGGYSIEDNIDVSEVDYEIYYAPYYNTFDGIYLMDQEANVRIFDLMDSFYNNKTVNDFEWEDEDDAVPEKEYAYMGIIVDDDFDCDSIALYMKADVTCSMKISIFKSDTFSMTCTYDKVKKDYDELEDGDEEPKLSDYDKYANETPIGEATVHFKEGEWVSFSVVFFKKGDASKPAYSFNDGDCILLRFENNTGFGYVAGLDKVKFTTTNLLIRKHDASKD